MLIQIKYKIFQLDESWVIGMVGPQSHPHGNPWGRSLLLNKIEPLKKYKVE